MNAVVRYIFFSRRKHPARRSHTGSPVLSRVDTVTGLSRKTGDPGYRKNDMHFAQVIEITGDGTRQSRSQERLPRERWRDLSGSSSVTGGSVPSGVGTLMVDFLIVVTVFTGCPGNCFYRGRCTSGGKRCEQGIETCPLAFGNINGFFVSPGPRSSLRLLRVIHPYRYYT